MKAARAILLALAVVGAQAFVSDGDSPLAGPLAGAPKRLSGNVTTAASGDRYLGRLESALGYGSYLCYAKYLYGGQQPAADATIITRLAPFAEPEAVPSAGPVPTITEVATWAAGKFGIDPETLIPEDLSPQVASNDWVDTAGVRHVRLIQYSKEWDATVELGSVVVHLLGNKATFVSGGAIVDLGSRSAQSVGVASEGTGFITPEQGASAALRAALDAVPDMPKSVAARLRAAAARPTPSTLAAAAAEPMRTKRVVHCAGDGKCWPAYKQVVFLPATASSTPQEAHVYVSAFNGSVLMLANRLRTHEPEAPGAPGAGGSAEPTKKSMWMSMGHGKSLYSGEVPLNTAQSASSAKGGPYQLVDMVNNAATYDMRNKEDNTDGGPTVEFMFHDKDNQWGDSSPLDRQTAAVDAHYGASTTLYYYKDVHNRIGVDGRGGDLTSRVHLSKGYDNAYWYNNRMTYGDGSRDPKEMTTSCTGFPPMVTLDIAAHELSHGVTEYTSGLIYEHSYGGINEGFSDIMAQCVLDYAHENQNAPKGADFLVGSALYSSSCSRKFLRSMIDPTADGFRSSACWHKKFDVTFEETHSGQPMYCKVDVHWSSGVANRAFYLMAKGLNNTCGNSTTPGAMGIKDACKVFYRSTQSYLSRVADYYELRQSTKMAAEDLFGKNSTQAATVVAAWDAVGAPTKPYPDYSAPACDATVGTKAAKSCDA